MAAFGTRRFEPGAWPWTPRPIPSRPGVCKTRPVSGQLILIRHSKTEDGTIDVQRALTSRGRADAAAVGRLLGAAGVRPDLAVVSPASRARQTWELAQAVLAEPVEVVVDERIYQNEVGVLRQVVAETGADVGCLVLVGHNPSVAEFAQLLDDEQGDPDARDRLRTGYPTSGVAIFEVAGGWDALTPHSATLRSLDVGRAPA
jgi:phosphohistidine phosphatase